LYKFIRGADFMDKINDEKIEMSIRTLLDKEMLNSALDKRVICRDGFVTLTGFADTLAEKSAAEELARRIEGVKSVENCLTISTDGTFSDKDTEAEVLNKLRNEDRFTPISAKVHGGEAVLEGKAATFKDKRDAIQAASKAFGVKDVISHIDIETAGKVDDATIKNRMEDGFVREHLDDCDIRVDVNNGNVKLSGFANTKGNVETAVEIAGGVEGVRNIKTDFKIRKPDHPVY
jgi:osmotically-inducible protein OsmY